MYFSAHVNIKTKRKTAPTGKLKGKSPVERKTQWLEHFKSLLRSSDNAPPFGEIPVFFISILFCQR